MSEEKNHIIYTADDIKKYITGAMSPAEMHAIEMAALDDRLLAEAMEGYDLMEQKDWSKELAALKQQFNKNEKEQALVIPIGNKANSFKWWKAAAAVIVLGATATTAYIFTKNNETAAPQNIASLEKSVSDSAGIVATDSINTIANINPAADSTTPLIAKVDKINATTGAETITTQGAVSADAYSPAVQERGTVTSKPAAAATYDDVAVNDRKDAARAKEYKAEEVAGNAANNADVAVNEKEFKNNAEESNVFTDETKASNNASYYNNTANSFSGLVVTPDNKPVSYANINIPQAKKAVFTDANGRFTITAPDTTVKITVSSAGYNVQKFTLQNAAVQNKIVLQPQDVATQTIGKKRVAVKKQQAIADSIAMEEEAEPAGGWVEYNNYLHDNLKSPTDARQSNVHGEVEVTVKLKNNGEISTVKVAKPLCPECDAEAVRLVKDGPKWDVKNNKKNKVKVKVKF